MITWKLAEFFFWLRKKIGKIQKNRPELSGEMWVFCKLDPPNNEGKTPTDLKVYFDKSLKLEQCQLIAEEIAGSFLRIRMNKEKQKEMLKKAINKSKKIAEKKVKAREKRKKKKKKK